MKIVKKLKGELEVKRFYVGRIKVTCPNCGKSTAFLETYTYISNPILGKKEVQHSCCDHCCAELEMNIKVNITIEYNPDKVKAI